MILPLSGSFKRYGEKIRAAIYSGLTCEANLILEDEACDPNTSQTALAKLLTIDQVKLLIGPFCGSPQLVVAQSIKNKNVLSILASSAPETVAGESKGRMFSMQHSIESEAKFMAGELNKRGIKSVVSIYLDNFFSRSHEAAFQKEFKGQILETMAYTAEDLSQIKSIALRIKKIAPEALYVPDAFPLMNGLVKELQVVGLGHLKLYSPYSAEAEDVKDALGKYGSQLVYSYPKIEGEALSNYAKMAAEAACLIISSCPKEDLNCRLDALKKNYTFDQHGALPASFILKTIKENRFVELSS